MIKILCCYRKGFCLVVEDLATLDENPGFLIVDSGVRTIEYIGPTFLKELERIKKRIESLTTSALSGFGSSGVYLSNLGVRTEKDNTLSLNQTVLEKELDIPI